MFRSDWGIVAALVACLILAAAGLNDSYEQRFNNLRAESRFVPTEQIDRNRAGLPALAESYISNPDPLSANETERRDLAAQEASAVWAFWVVAVSLLGTLVTFVGTVLLYLQVKLTREAVQDTALATHAMREANKISERTLFLTQRAVLYAKPHVTFLKNNQEATVGVQVSMKVQNFGQTEAVNVASRFNGTHRPNPDLPPDFDYSGGSDCPVNVFIAGRSEPSFFGKMTVGTPYWEQVKAQTSHLFVYGTLSYSDIFSCVRHNIDYCFRIHMLGEEPSGAQTETYGPHNRTWETSSEGS